MILTAGMKLEAVLAGAPATTQPEVHVDWVAYNQQGERTVPATTRSAMNSGTDVTILAAPTTPFVREPLRIEFYNKDTASVTVTIKTDDGTERTILTATVGTLKSLIWEQGVPWYVTTA